MRARVDSVRKRRPIDPSRLLSLDLVAETTSVSLQPRMAMAGAIWKCQTGAKKLVLLALHAKTPLKALVATRRPPKGYRG